METKQWKDVLHIISGKNQKTVANPNGKYPIYGSGGIIGYADDYLCEAGTTIVGRKGTINKPIFVDEPFWNIDTAFGVVPGKKLNAKYLYYFCLYFNFMPLDKSTGRPSLAKSDLLKIKMPVPSLSKQEQIVKQIEESLSQLDSAVATLNKTKQQLEIYRQAVLKEAFDISAVKQGALSDLCSSIVDCPHSTPKWTKEGKLCLRTTNFKTGYLDLSEKNYVDQETFNLRNKRLVPLPGDIVYSREGAILGIACIIPDNTYACLGQRMMVIRTSDSLNNRFLMHFLNSPKVNAYIKKMTGGSASPHVNVKDIKALQMPLFSILQQEQMAKTIDAKLSICDSIELTVNQSLQQAEALRQSILKQAFEVE